MEVGEEELAQETTIIERADGKNKLSMSEDNCERQQEANQDKNVCFLKHFCRKKFKFYSNQRFGHYIFLALQIIDSTKPGS